MIQLSAPSISANAAKSNGAAPAASSKGSETGDFAALLGVAGTTAEAPEGVMQDMAAALTAALAGLPDGKTGKAGGKTLPVGEPAIADVAGADGTAAEDLLTNDAPDDSVSDPADVPIAAAIPVLPFIVPPLPGAGNPAEFRAADPVSTSTPANAPTTGPANGPAVTPAAVMAQALPKAVTQVAPTANGVPAQVLQVKLSPIVTADAQTQTDAKAGEEASADNSTQTAGGKAAITIQARIEALAVARPAAVNAAPTSAVTARVAPAAPENTAPVTANEPGPASFAAAAARPAVVNAAPTSAVAARFAPVAPENTAPVAVTEPAPSGRSNNPAPAASAAASLGGTETEPLRAEPAVQSATQPGIQISGTHVFATRAADVVPVTAATPAATEQPHDFATLVDRLSEAREAASPQVVRTALQHAEFGKIALQFRHDDANLSVTMANADPAFTSAVHSAVAASLGGNAAGSGEQSRGDGQQQQQASAQQQSAASGNGQGQQNAAQARAEQGERGFNRTQGPSTRAQQDQAASSGRTEADTRRSGIYA